MSIKTSKSRISHDIHCFDCSSRHLCIAGSVSDRAEIEHINNIIKNISILKKKEHLFHAYTPMKNLYAVYQGSCKEYWIDESGNECITNFYFPGDIIGMESIPERTHLLSVMALESTKLCVIPVDDLYLLMQEKSNILKRYIDITGFKMRNDRSTKGGVTANERVSDFLVNITSRMLERNKTEKNIPLPMSQLDISNFLGMTHETVNRTFKYLKRKKIIKIKKRVMEVLNLAELERLGRLSNSLKSISID